MLRLLGIPDADILMINASRDRLVDDIQEKIVNFVSTWAFNDSGIKYVILDEADKLSPMAQGLLRGEIERFSDVCRFALTCNAVNKITDPIKSRCQGFHFLTLDRDDFTARAGEILVKEGIEFDVETLVSHVDATYPDMRKCIGMLQQHSTTGTLIAFAVADMEGAQDYLIDVIAMIMGGDLLGARKRLVAEAPPEDYPDIYRYFYRNLEIWSDTRQGQDEAILIIRRALVNHPNVADIEINLAACMVELSRLR
jgi:DNA polymerase III delta prime subunit